MKTELNYIPAAHVGEVWRLAESFLEQMIPRSNGRLSRGSLARDLVAGRLQLWLAWAPETKEVRAAALTEVYTAPTGLSVCTVRGCAGQGAEDWVHHLGTIETWAREQGCAVMEAMARKGWAKHLGDYKMTHVLLEKPLHAVAEAAHVGR